MNKIFMLSLVLGAIWWLGGCASVSGIAKVEPAKKKIAFESTDDGLSALHNAENASVLEKSTQNQTNVLQASPRDVGALVNLAQLKIAENNLKAAEWYIRKALVIDVKSRNARMVLAEINLRHKNYDMAQIIINGLGGVESKDSQIVNMQAIISVENNQYSKALAQFKLAIDLDQTNVAARMNLGVLYLNYRQMKNAAVQFERVLKIMPGHNDAKLHLAVINATRGNMNDAEQVYRAILSKTKDNPLALYNFAALERSRQNYDEAISYLNRYLDTSYAKKSTSKSVYAFIEDIKKSQQELQGRVSDAQIQELANKIGEAEKMQTARAQVEAKEKVKEKEKDKEVVKQPEAPVEQAPVKPAKTVEPAAAKPTSIDDEIKSLEKEIQ